MLHFVKTQISYFIRVEIEKKIKIEEALGGAGVFRWGIFLWVNFLKFEIFKKNLNSITHHR